MSSPYDVIEVVIDKTEAPAGCLGHLQGPKSVISDWLEQIEFFSAADSRPAVVDPQFFEDAFGVGSQCVE